MTKTKTAQTQKIAMELNMTPMIDVIFQLIIFFMCSIHFKSLEGKLYAYGPKDKGMHPITQTDFVLAEVRIKLTYSENTPLMANIRVGDTDFKDLNSLEQHLKNLAPSLIMPDGLDVIPVKIDADGNVPAQAVVSVLNICKKTGVQKTEFAAKSSPSPPSK